MRYVLHDLLRSVGWLEEKRWEEQLEYCDYQKEMQLVIMKDSDS